MCKVVCVCAVAGNLTPLGQSRQVCHSTSDLLLYFTIKTALCCLLCVCSVLFSSCLMPFPELTFLSSSPHSDLFSLSFYWSNLFFCLSPPQLLPLDLNLSYFKPPFCFSLHIPHFFNLYSYLHYSTLLTFPLSTNPYTLC